MVGGAFPNNRPQAFFYSVNVPDSNDPWIPQAAKTATGYKFTVRVETWEFGTNLAQGPKAVDDSYATVRNQTLVVPSSSGLLGNDYNSGSGSLTVVAINGNGAVVGTPVTLTSGATLTANADGSFTYQPAAGYVGQDSFTYTLSNGSAQDTATALIDVTNQAVWTGAGNDGAWGNPANWSGNVLPGPNDDVSIPNGATVTLSTGNVAAKSLNVAGALIVSGGSLSVAGDSMFQNLTLSGGSLGGAGNLTVTGTLSWTGGTLAGTGLFVLNTSATANLAGSSLVVGGSSIINYGTLTLGAGTALELNGGAALTNYGTVLLYAGAGMTSASGDGLLDNEGSLSADGGGTVTINTAFANGGSLTVVSGTLSVQGDLFQDNDTGGITVDAGRVLSVNQDLTEYAGSITIANGATLDVGGSIDVAAGTITLTGGTIAAATAQVEQGAELGGSGTITANVTNAGVIDVGGVSAIGTLQVNGSYTQGSTGILNMEISGPSASQIDQLMIAGQANLGGTLNVSLLGGFTPSTSQVYSLLSYGSRSNTFATLNLPTFSGGTFDPRYDDPLYPNAFTLWVV